MNREKSSTLSKKGQSPGSQDDSAPGHKIMKQSKREHKMSMAESFFFNHRKCNEKSGHYEKRIFFKEPTELMETKYT